MSSQISPDDGGTSPERPSPLERLLRIFTDIRQGEGPTGLILLLNIFLVLAAYYLIKPVREGWLSISAVKGLSKIEVKAYSSFAQSIVLLLVIPLYAFLASRLSRRALITSVTLFFMSNLVLFWLFQPGLLDRRIPYVGVVFYLWVGVFSVTVVAQFWAFAADLYSDEQGKRLFPLIAVGASAGASAGSWLTECLIKSLGVEPFNLILISTAPLAAALVLTWVADRRGSGGRRAFEMQPEKGLPAAPDRTGAYRLIFGNKYLLAAAFLGLLVNWVNTNGENILFGAVQAALESQYLSNGLTDPDAIARFVKHGTTAFYGNLYFWVNLSGLLIQAFLVSRILKFGGFAAIIFITPVLSLLSYSLMALFPVLVVIRVMKIAENSTNYSVNNTARNVLWLPLPAAVIYKAKAATDTLFVRIGDGLAALTVLVGTQIILLSLKQFLVLNLFLVFAWGAVAAILAKEHQQLMKGTSAQ